MKSLLPAPILIGPNYPNQVWTSAPFSLTQPIGTSNLNIIWGYLDTNATSNMPFITTVSHYTYNYRRANTTVGLGISTSGGNAGEAATINPTTNRIALDFSENSPVIFYNPGGATLPSELQFNKVYYTINCVSGVTPSLQLAETVGGKPIDFSSAGSGTASLLELSSGGISLITGLAPTMSVELAPPVDMQLVDVVLVAPT
jgi:hypothetical protein